jgi:sirohydrochlorin cobaltochelatase
MPIRDAALLLLGHGSTLNADSSAPTYQHAEEIRRRGVFAEVHVAFWKEEPNFRQAMRQTRRRQVYVVPNFISSGYFTEQIIPRELGLTGPVTRLDGQDIFYCQPVGLNPEMTEALLHRAADVVAVSAEKIADPAKSTCLFICGHGTSLNDNSTKIIYEQAAAIRARGLYADCQPVLMEQSPFVKDWRSLTKCPDVIVVPFFISDGLHSFEDIPVLLGLTHNIREQGFTNPHREDYRRLWYATAIGTDSSMADVILAQVRQFQNDRLETRNLGDAFCNGPVVRDEFTDFVYDNPGPWKIGQVAIRRTEDDSYHLMHQADLDRDPSSLRILPAPEDLREVLRVDSESHFRPLRAAPNLQSGWLLHAPDLPSAILALEYIYPGELDNWTLWKHHNLPVTPWHETAERQTGRFRIVRDIDDASILDLTAQVCDSGCLKRRLWSPAAQDVAPASSEIPLLCPEACNCLVGKAREKLKGPEAEND